MIAPYREWWWEKVLLNDQGRYPDPGYNLAEMIAEEEDIPWFAANLICTGARRDGILEHDKTHDDLAYKGVDDVDQSETPSYLKDARDIARDGITRRWDSDVLAFHGPTLVRRASYSLGRLGGFDKGAFWIRCDRLSRYIQNVTGVSEARADRFLENEKEDDGILNIHNNIAESKIICDDMKGISIITEW